MRGPSFRAAAVLALFLASSCTVAFHRVQQCDTVYFGTARSEGPAVSEEEWLSFVEDVVGPRFPSFTVWTATGHWNRLREKTYVLQIVHPDSGEVDRMVSEIARAYKERFKQEAVFIVRTRALAWVE